MSRTLLLAVALLSLSGTAVMADSSLEHTLVTGTYAAMDVADQTASITVLDAAAIEALNKRSVTDILRTVPGVLIEEQGGPGGLSAVSIRGGDSNFTLVLLDGVAVNDPTNSRGGGFDFSRLDPAAIERIEVVRGPQSAIYGSDALAGVINIISHRGQSRAHQSLWASTGSDDYSRYSAMASGMAGPVAYAIDWAGRDDGEPVPGSTRNTEQAGLRLDWQATPEHRLNLSYRVLDGDSSSYPEQSGGPEYAVLDALDVSDYRDQALAVGWQADITALWRSALRASYYEHDEVYASPGIYPFDAVPPNGADSEFERRQLQWVNTLALSEMYTANIGADYRDEDGVSRGYLDFGGFELPTDFELDRTTNGLFMDLQASVNPAVLLKGSARYDDPDGYDGQTSLNLGASYAVTPRTTLSANWGEAYKLPSFSALGHPLVGNPALVPETADSWDISLGWGSGADIDLRATIFSNDYKDLIDFDSELFRNVNRANVESRGVELQAQWRPVAVLELNAQFTYTDLELKDDGAPLLGRPKRRAGVTGRWQLSSAWATTLDMQWTGEQYASSLYTGESVVETLDDYTRVDWNVSWEVNSQVQLELAFDNLLDEAYRNAVGFNAPGRSVRLGIKFEHES